MCDVLQHPPWLPAAIQGPRVAALSYASLSSLECGDLQRSLQHVQPQQLPMPHRSFERLLQGQNTSMVRVLCFHKYNTYILKNQIIY